MAEESLNLVDIEGKSELNGYNSGTASEGKSGSPGNESAVLFENHSESSISGDNASNPRRNSTGKPRPKPSFEKIVPHYLRASTGSCHDLCKYGRKHEFEEKESRPWPRRIIKAHSSQQNSVVAAALGERNKPTMLKHTWPHMRQNPILAAPLGEKRKTKVVKEITLPYMTQNPAVIAPLGEKRKTKVVKEITLPHMTENPAVIAPLGEKRKAKVVKEITLPHMSENPAVIAPLGEKRKARVVKEITLAPMTKNLAVSEPLGGRKKEIVHNQMASSERKQSQPGTALLDVGKIARMHKQMASPDRKQSPPLLEKKKATVKQITSPDRIFVSFHKASPTAIKLEKHHKNIKQKVISPSKEVEDSSKKLSSRKNSNVEKRMSKSSNQRSPVVHPPPVKPLSTSHALALVKRTGKAEKTTKSVSPKSSPSVRLIIPTSKSSLSVRTLEGSFVRGKGRDNIATCKNMVLAKASAKKVSTLPAASYSPCITKYVASKGKKSNSPELMPFLSDQHSKLKAVMGEPEKENVPEKTLHVIATEPKSNLSEFTGDDEVIPPIAPESFPSPGPSSACQSSSVSPTEDGDHRENLEGEIENGGEVKEEIETAQGVEKTDDNDSVDEQEEVKEEEEIEEEEDEEYSLEEGKDEDVEEVEDNEDPHALEDDVDEVISDKGGKASNNDIKVVLENGAKILQKSSVTSESKDAIQKKIKFRRGRVVDLQSESSGPRRLRFRRVRGVDENRDHMSELKMRSFKKKGGDGDESIPKPDNEEVVLRHQDDQGMKDAQGLLNNVIEETASKLAESRKSKVKALVGAFETVISLQDTKPSS